MILVRVGWMLVLAALVSAAPATAQQDTRSVQRYCLQAGATHSGSSPPARYMFIDLIRWSRGDTLVSFYSGLAASKPKLWISDTHASVKNRVISLDFLDNWGAGARGEVREADGGIEIKIIRVSPPASAEPDSDANYGTFQLTKDACGSIANEPANRHVQSTDYDDWRYVEGKGKAGAAEYLIRNGVGAPPHVVFRATCDRPRELLVEYFGVHELTEAEKQEPLVIGLYLAGEATPFTAHSLKASPSKDRMSGRLPLDNAKAADFARAGSITLDAPNGPQNPFVGGKSLALKRIARECSE